jgi:hypothetical protein
VPTEIARSTAGGEPPGGQGFQALLDLVGRLTARQHLSRVVDHRPPGGVDVDAVAADLDAEATGIAVPSNEVGLT